MMNTVMPAIYTKYMNMAGIIARERIMEGLRKEDIPVASVESEYVGGVGTLGDEEFFVSVKTSPEHVLSAMTHISKAVSSLDYCKIGARIRKFRKAKGYSQEFLAEKVDISTTHMSHIETGSTKLSLPVLVDIAAVLGVTTDALLFEEAQQNLSIPSADLVSFLQQCTPKESKLLLEILQATKAAIDKYL